MSVILPGGFSHGDYLRTGAIARFSPVMDAVQEFAAAGGPVLGICNGFQILLEAGLLPGAMLRNRELKFRCEHVHVRVEETDTPFTLACRPQQVLRIPIAHGEGNYFTTPDELSSSSRTGRSCSGTSMRQAWSATRPTRTGRSTSIAGICNERRNVVGLMPHPGARLRTGARQRGRPRHVRVGAWPRCAAGRADGGRERFGMSAIDKATLDRHGLNDDEYQRIVEALGREPNLTELGIFSVMWTEHCSYKSSRVHLRNAADDRAAGAAGPRRERRRLDIGDGLAAVFKIESHNHPSFIEPYQGAATGVGGIIRDIFTMGARPIALMNSLRFGVARRSARPPQHGRRRGRDRRLRQLLRHPDRWRRGRLRGVLRRQSAGQRLLPRHRQDDEIVKGVATGIGNPVFYVGAKTGRDGIHGATMASAEFDEKSAEKRPAVQVGDPFMEKLLLEACLEVMQTERSSASRTWAPPG